MICYIMHIKDKKPIAVTFRDKGQSRNFLKEGDHIVKLNTEKCSIFISSGSFVALVPKDIEIQPVST